MRTSLTHYRLESEIGRGGMGVVYRAVDTRLNRPVAIKLLAPGAAADAERIKRFVQEARSASALNHPGIITIYEVDEQDGTTFIAMELVEGTPLDRLLASGPLPVARALDVAAQIGSALEAAHTRGIVHRDIKPANVIVCDDDRVKVLDFGLAKLFERAPTAETVSALATRQGEVMGTPAYMSPEQAEARPVDARSDVFSLGAVLYEMLAGRRAFAGDSDVGIITSILRDRPPLLRSVRPDAPAGVQAIVDRALAKDPAGRYANVGAMRSDLLALQASLHRQKDYFWKRPAVLAPLAVLLIAAAALGVWQYVQARRALWVRTTAIPEIEQMHASEQYVQAFRRLREVEPYAAADVASVRKGWYPPAFNTKPDGVEVAIKNYLDVNGSWEPLGRTPLQTTLPFGYYRVRLSKEGFEPIELSSPAGGRPRFAIALTPEGTAPGDMVRVAGGTFGFGAIRPVTVPDFWFGRLEVTNQEYKRFVDAGGYRDARFWKTPFQENGRTLSFTEAMARFRDTTGRPGPATWELGTFPAGTEAFPVGGISWFEAAAFAEFSGNTLPTVHQFFLAANLEEISADILRLSNFDNKGPRRAGESGAVGPWGTIDMAGNVAEWCLNVAQGSTLRYVLGG
ncbi:MAG TPA: protein kinase, partial [Vicinamibacterales bacterium]|nr:protein kinase [Vicinamibacterales bacterium]